MTRKDDAQFKLRLPVDIRNWIDGQAALNRSSKSSEIVRAIRERMERQEAKAA